MVYVAIFVPSELRVTPRRRPILRRRRRRRRTSHDWRRSTNGRLRKIDGYRNRFNTGWRHHRPTMRSSINSTTRFVFVRPVTGCTIPSMRKPRLFDILRCGQRRQQRTMLLRRRLVARLRRRVVVVRILQPRNSCVSIVGILGHDDNRMRIHSHHNTRRRRSHKKITPSIP